MKTVSCLLLVLLASVTANAYPDPARLRAKAALALTFAEPEAKPKTTYSDRYAEAVRDAKPLLVWVGQPARCVPGCVCHEAKSFPDAGPVSVIVGVPTEVGTLRRVDLPGRPSDAAIRAVLAEPFANSGQREVIVVPKPS